MIQRDTYRSHHAFFQITKYWEGTWVVGDDWLPRYAKEVRMMPRLDPAITQDLAFLHRLRASRSRKDEGGEPFIRRQRTQNVSLSLARFSR